MKRNLQFIKKTGILFSLFLFGFNTSQAATADATKWLYPTSYKNDIAVINPQYALKGAGDQNSALFYNSGDEVTYINFDIPEFPASFQITGIIVHLIGATSDSRQLSVDLTWDGGTNFTTTSYKTSFNIYNPEWGYGYSSLGGSIDAWGRTAWTSDELSNSNFGIRLIADDGEGLAELAEIAVQVFYYVPADYCNGSAVFAEGIFYVENSQNAVGEPDGNVAVLPRYDVLELDLTGGTGIYRPANSTVKVRWAKTDPADGNITVQVCRSENLFYNPVINTYTINSSELTDQVIPLDGNARYLIFQYNTSSLSIDAVTYLCDCDNCAPSVVVQNYCGFSLLTAYDYTGTLEWSTGETTQSIEVNAEGTYTVTQTVEGVISEEGSGVAEPMVLPDAPGPISGPANPCEGTQVVYGISPVNGATYYQWYSPEDWPIQDGQGTPQITVLVGPNYDEEAAVSVYVRNDECTNPANSYLLVQSTMICCTQGEPDMYENNNSMQTAAQINVGDPAISANILDSKDADWFYFETGDAGLYHVNYVPGSTAETMTLYNSSARKLKPTERTGTTYSLLANTIYYIKVNAKLRSPAPCYSLGVEMLSSALFASEQYDELKSAEIETIPKGVLKIWPNPTKNEYQFYNGNETPVKVRILDLTGRQIETIENVGIAETVVFGSKYKPGIYFVNTSENGVQKVFKLIKQ
jgi:hypothetical protein